VKRKRKCGNGRVKMAYRLTMAFHKRGASLVFGVTNSLLFNKEKAMSLLTSGLIMAAGRKQTGAHATEQRNCMQRDL
jgi:hypothetical protein